jgi:hypothetical protein
MSDVSQALQHGAPREANKEKTVEKQKSLNKCIRKLPKRQSKRHCSKQILEGVKSKIASNISSNDSTELHSLNNESVESSTRYMLGNNSIHHDLSLNESVCNRLENSSILRTLPIVDAAQKLKSSLQHLEHSQECQLREKIGFRPVAHSSLIDMMSEGNENVSKTIFSRNNLAITDQQEIYSQVNKILADQIKEIREYVDQIKASLPSKPAQVLNENPIGANTIMNERDKKTGEKEIDRMLKVMPYFNGDSSDNFESWVLSAKKTLSYGKHCTEEQKLDVILTKVRGNALETLEDCGNLNTADLVFSSLKKTYGKDQRAIISNVKQLQNESVKLFSVRLKNNLRALGIVENTSNPSVIALDYFISGLLPTISKRVKALLPENYSAAEGYAFQIECENPSLISKKPDSLNNVDAPSEKLFKIEKVDQCLNSFKENQSNSNKSLHEKLNALSKQITNWSQNPQNQSSTPCTSGSRAHPYNRNGNGNDRLKSPKVYRGTCFGCNTTGHTFYDCKKITGEKRDEIRQNFSAYLAKYRAEKAQEKPLNSFGETTNSQ